jgi:hypothetical protein
MNENDNKITTSSENDKTRVSEWIQGTIWVLSLVSIPLYFHDILTKEADFGKYLATIIFGIVSLAQQIAIYLDIHSFENKIDEAKKEYGDWINHWGERFLRYMIFFGLLFGAGKVTEAIYSFLSRVGYYGSQGNFYEFIKPDGKTHNYMFVMGASFVFLFIILWNIGALYYRKKITSTEKPKKNWITTRIKFFTFSAIFALSYWLIILFDGNDAVGIFAILSLVIYSVTALIATLLSSNRILDSVVNYYSQK